jgi:hypothetical protein
MLRRITLCGPSNNRRFGGTYHLHHQGDKNRRARDNYLFPRSVLRLLVTAEAVLSSPTLAALMMMIRSSEKSVLTRDTRRHIPEDGILHSLRQENLRSYIALTGLAL